MELLIVTGMSGSGKSKALNILEDNGFYCLDNLPTKLLGTIMDMIVQLPDFPEKVAVTADTRNKDMVQELKKVLSSLKQSVPTKLLFLDSEDLVILKRYKETRRLHPLMSYDEGLTLETAIAEERVMLEGIRQRADYCIDTSMLTTVQLREKILTVVTGGEPGQMKISFTAFGYKHGIPSDADLVFDVRCLPNPFYVERLKPLTGYDSEVRDFVMSFEDSRKLFETIRMYLECALPMYEREGKAQLVVAVGCTGGQHRSLTFALLLSEYFENKGYNCKAGSRDIADK